MLNFRRFIFFITALLSCSAAYASKEQTLYIMLNIDNTLVDRILPCTQEAINQLSKEGFKSQALEFDADKKSSPKFISMYEKIANHQPLAEESEYMSKIVSQKVGDKFHIQECVVVRPSIQHFLEQLNDIRIPVKILLTSRNDDTRTQNLHDNLDLKIAGKPFKDASIFIPRDWFRIKTQSGSVKSSELLREKYPLIQQQDVVILFDFLPASRFIKGNHGQDFNIEVSKFEVKEYNQQQDIKEMDDILLMIQKKCCP